CRRCGAIAPRCATRTRRRRTLRRGRGRARSWSELRCGAGDVGGCGGGEPGGGAEGCGVDLHGGEPGGDQTGLEVVWVEEAVRGPVSEVHGAGGEPVGEVVADEGATG